MRVTLGATVGQPLQNERQPPPPPSPPLKFERGQLVLFHRGEAYYNSAEIRDATALPCSTMAASHLQSDVQMDWSDVEQWAGECEVSYDSSMI